MNDAKWTLIVRSCIAGLPSNLDERRETIDALHGEMPVNHPLYPQVRSILQHLDNHKIAVREFGQMSFTDKIQ